VASELGVKRASVPAGRRDRPSVAVGPVAQPLELTGVLRWPDDRHWFPPADDPGHNLWFSRDPAGIAAAKGLDPKTVAPFYVEQEAPAPPGGLPQPRRLAVSLPDDHLHYDIRSYGLPAL